MARNIFTNLLIVMLKHATRSLKGNANCMRNMC